MGVTRRTVVRYYCTREVYNFDGDPKVQRQSFADIRAAWKWVARASLFRARDIRGCASYRDDCPCNCKLCDPERYGPVVERLARIMRHRAEKEAKP